MDWSNTYGTSTKNSQYSGYQVTVQANGTRKDFNQINVSPITGARYRDFYRNNYPVFRGKFALKPANLYIRQSTNVISSKPCFATRPWTLAGGHHLEALTYSTDFPRIGNGENLKEGFDTQLRQQAITECLAELGSQGAQALTTLAEARKSYSSLGKIANQMATFLLAVRKGNLKQAFSALIGGDVKNYRTYTRMWLEYNYAWGSLVRDMEGIIENIVDTSVLDTTNLWLKASKGKSSSIEEPINRASNDGQFTHVGTHNYKYWYVTHLLARVDDRYIREANKYGLANFGLNTAWEIVPYSFLVDWLIPIGTFLEASTASSGLIFGTGSTTFYCEGTSRASVSRRTAGWTTLSPGSFVVEYRYVKRNNYIDWPMALPYIKSPLSTKHVTSALALIAQLRLNTGAPKHNVRKYRGKRGKPKGYNSKGSRS